MADAHCYLVVGSSGHLGEALMKTLPERMREEAEVRGGVSTDKKDIRVIGIDRRPSPYTTHVVDISVDVHQVAQAPPPHLPDGSTPTTTASASCLSLAELFNRYQFNGIFHTAALQKPHIDSHTEQEFIQTNLLGTQRLVDLAVQHNVPNFIFTSTTSTFGKVIQRSDDLTQHAKLGKKKQCIWLNEEVQAIPRNIYGITKVSGEQLCFLAAELSRKKNQKNTESPRRDLFNCVVLRTSRFFLEGDDEEVTRNSIDDCNLKVNEFLYRRLDLSDLVDGHILAMKKAQELSGEIFVLSGPPPFKPQDVSELGEPVEMEEEGKPSARLLEVLNETLNEYRRKGNADDDAEAAGEHRDHPSCSSVEEVYRELGWKLPVWFDRLYDSSKAVRVMGWKPQYTWASQLMAAFEEKKRRDKDGKEGTTSGSVVDYTEICSSTHRSIGRKSYHDDGRTYVN